MNITDQHGNQLNGKKRFLEFATITPTRGDRTELLKYCKRQIAKQTLQPSKSYFIDFPPETINKFDLVDRVKKGVEMAKADGFDWVVILEDDDNIGHQYLSNLLEGILVNGDIGFIGCSKSLYYNLKTNTYQLYDHPKRSSLFQTAFRISALKGNSVLNHFNWPDSDSSFLDMALWKYAEHNAMSLLHESPLAVGIKHGIGMCGGKGHRTKLQHFDHEREFLKTIVDEESFAFYQDLKV